jgi:hypothetical protein
MSRRKQQKTGECVYCGKVAPITEDHVPPKNLFAKPRPNNLIKVPSCKECHSENKQVSQDDEYFRLMLTLREDTANHPDVEKILPIVLRSLARPDKIGFAKSLIKNMKKVNVRTQSGLYLGTKPAYDVNLTRLDNVARRITKGLFYYETGSRLLDEYEVFSFSESGLRNVTDKVKQHLKEKILRPLMSNSAKIIGKQVFSYRVSFSDKDANSSVWLFIFYKRIAFLCMTLPKKEIIGHNV